MQTSPSVDEGLISPWMVVALRDAAEARRDWWVERERLIEEARIRTAPDAVSRLTGFFAFPDRATAEDRIATWGWELTNLAEIEIDSVSKISRHDSQWIDAMGTNPQAAQAKAYAQGAAFNDTPKWELLVSGRATILGSSLRMRALEIVRECWPRSLFFAEIGRLAAIAGENAGYISAQIYQVDATTVGVRWLMKEIPRTPEFARKIGELLARASESEVNLKAIGNVNGPPLQTPDLTPMEFSLPFEYAQRMLRG